MTGKRVVLLGATGMVGGLALKFCLENPDVSMVTSIGRRPTGITHEKLNEVEHEDYSDFSDIADAMGDQDGVLFCLGAYTGAVPDDEFRRITVDYALSFARAMYKVSPDAAFCLLSGQGADQTEKSRVAFARYKGMAENGLLATGFPRVHIFRPGYIYPVTPRKEPNLMYSVSRKLYPVLRFLYPNIGVSSEHLALTMVHAGLHGTGDYKNPILENKDIRLMVTE
jgi:uncharacterized protein YbjT (DUF2867 family)